MESLFSRHLNHRKRLRLILRVWIGRPKHSWKSVCGISNLFLLPPCLDGFPLALEECAILHIPLLVLQNLSGGLCRKLHGTSIQESRIALKVWSEFGYWGPRIYKCSSTYCNKIFFAYICSYACIELFIEPIMVVFDVEMQWTPHQSEPLPSLAKPNSQVWIK